jgi:hypothetical protein
MRKQLELFANLCEERLANNDHKQPWQDLTCDLLAHKLRNKTDRLSDAVSCNDLGDMREYALDVSNYAMMVHANATKRMVKRRE